ncbi:MAG: REP-associated tyrosine transposase [Janthinobacterium lividum]
MPDYRRNLVAGGSYFFTVNLLDRGSDLLVARIDVLRDAVRQVRAGAPFVIDAWVVLLDHMHCVCTLPEGDADFPGRWRAIKTRFSKALPGAGGPSDAMARRASGDLAAPIRGAYDPRCRRLRGARGLQALQSGEAWVCRRRIGRIRHFAGVSRRARMPRIGRAGRAKRRR